MLDGVTTRGGRQTEGAPPVVENTELPRMDEGALRPRRIGRRVLRMEAEPRPDEGVRGGEERMSPAAYGRPEPEGGGQERPPQEAKAAAPVAEGYIRLRVRVEGGVMSVVGAREVEGPLVMPAELASGFAYEVSVGPRRISVGSIPDLGVSRSFPDPQGPPELQVHHITEESSYEFNVRVPRRELTLAALPRTQIALYVVKESVAGRAIGAESLGLQFDRELREVARLRGIRVEDFPEAVREEIQRAVE